MKDIQVGYRTESYSGSKVRDAVSVLLYETVDLGNRDCLEGCYKIIKNTEMGRVLGKVLESMDEQDTPFSPSHFPLGYKSLTSRNFIEKVLEAVNEETGQHIKYALWLADKHVAMGEFQDGGYGGTKNNTAMYVQGPVRFLDIGPEGALFGYPYEPVPLSMALEQPVRKELQELDRDGIVNSDVLCTVEAKASKVVSLLKQGVRISKYAGLADSDELALSSLLNGKDKKSVREMVANLAYRDNEFSKILLKDNELGLGDGKTWIDAALSGLLKKRGIRKTIHTVFALNGIEEQTNNIDCLNAHEEFLIMVKEGKKAVIPLNDLALTEMKLDKYHAFNPEKMYRVSYGKQIVSISHKEAEILIKDSLEKKVEKICAGDVLHVSIPKEKTYICTLEGKFAEVEKTGDMYNPYRPVYPVLLQKKSFVLNMVKAGGCQKIEHSVYPLKTMCNFLKTKSVLMVVPQHRTKQHVKKAVPSVRMMDNVMADVAGR